jgi:acetolactate synthase II small subunit
MHAISIRIRPAEGAALRALGLTERRGFRVLSMNLEPGDESSQQLSMLVTSSDRSVQVLGRQLERLYDVEDVSVNPAETAVQQPVPMRVVAGVS